MLQRIFNHRTTARRELKLKTLRRHASRSRLKLNNFLRSTENVSDFQWQRKLEVSDFSTTALLQWLWHAKTDWFYIGDQDGQLVSAWNSQIKNMIANMQNSSKGNLSVSSFLYAFIRGYVAVKMKQTKKIETKGRSQTTQHPEIQNISPVFHWKNIWEPSAK